LSFEIHPSPQALPVVQILQHVRAGEVAGGLVGCATVATSVFVGSGAIVGVDEGIPVDSNVGINSVAVGDNVSVGSSGVTVGTIVAAGANVAEGGGVGTSVAVGSGVKAGAGAGAGEVGAATSVGDSRPKRVRGTAQAQAARIRAAQPMRALPARLFCQVNLSVFMFPPRKVLLSLPLPIHLDNPPGRLLIISFQIDSA
jgi:hypothetical protein